MTYALDTNTISYILRGEGGVKQRWMQEESSGNRTVVPLIAYYEVRRGLLASDATTKMKSFEELCDVLGISELTISNMKKASAIYAKLKRQGNLIDDSDILIAAQCVENVYTLVTNNERHFARVDGLQLINWFLEASDDT